MLMSEYGKVYELLVDLKATLEKRELNILRVKAICGDVQARFELAKCYELGELTKQNHYKAFKWYLLIAEEEHAEAQYRLAKMYINGHISNLRGNGLRHLFDKIVFERRSFILSKEWHYDYWLMRSAKNGYAEAQAELGKKYFMEDNLIEAYYWCKFAAWQGNILGISILERILKDRRI